MNFDKQDCEQVCHKWNSIFHKNSTQQIQERLMTMVAHTCFLKVKDEVLILKKREW